MPRIFFATDIHGSDICWRKFLNAGKFYEADVLILGGDMTGKALVPILALPDGRYKATLLQQEFYLEDEEAVADMERRVRSRGYYPFRVTGEQLANFEADPAKVDAFFHQQMLDVVAQWMALADERLAGSGLRCYVCPGNDDEAEVDDVVRQARHVELAEGRVVDLGDGFRMISTGWSNITPWNTYREAPEEELAEKIERMVAMLDGSKDEMKRTIFNFHCPPYGSNLDEAPEIDSELNVKEAGARSCRWAAPPCVTPSSSTSRCSRFMVTYTRARARRGSARRWRLIPAVCTNRGLAVCRRRALLHG
jgi:uncharacterized protein